MKKVIKYVLIIIGIFWLIISLQNLSMEFSKNPSSVLSLLLVIIALLFWVIHKTKETEELEYQNNLQNERLREEAENLGVEIEEMEIELNGAIESVDVIKEDILLEENSIRIEDIEEVKERLREIKKYIREIKKETTEKIELLSEKIDQL